MNDWGWGELGNCSRLQNSKGDKTECNTTSSVESWIKKVTKDIFGKIRNLNMKYVY